MKSSGLSRRAFISSVTAGACVIAAADPLLSFSKAKSPVPQTSDLLFYLDTYGKKRPVTTLADWGIKRKQILEGLQQAMGALPLQKQWPAFKLQISEQQKEEHYIRHTISFTVAENETLPAYLYVPNGASKKNKHPAMLALHETDMIGKRSVDGQGKNANLAYAKELAARGYVVIAPDYPSFGDLEKYDFQTDRYQSGMMKSIFDGMRCVDLLLQRPDVDPRRIGVIGHSLGGHSAMFLGAFDTRLKVVVSSCGWTLMDFYNIGQDASKKFGGTLGPWAQERYMPLIREKYSLDPGKLPFDFDEVIAAIAPRGFFSSSPLNDSNFDVNGVKKGVAEVSEVYSFLKANSKLQVRYPESKHDFPPAVRMEAYAFVDKIFNFNPVNRKTI